MKSVSESQFYHSYANSQPMEISGNCVSTCAQPSVFTYPESYSTPEHSFASNPVFYKAHEPVPAISCQSPESFAKSASSNEAKNSSRQSKKQKNASKTCLLIKKTASKNM